MNFASTRFLRLKILTASNRCKYTPTKEFHISACGLKNKEFSERYKPCEKVKANLELSYVQLSGLFSQRAKDLEHATTGITEICTGPGNTSLVSTVFKLSDWENKYVDCLTEAHFKPLKHIKFRKRRKITREKLGTGSEWIKSPDHCSHILEQLHILVIKNLCREILGNEDYWTIHLNNPIPLPLRIAHKKLSGLTNQEVLDHFKSTDCLVEAKEQSSLKKKKKSSSKTARKKLTVNNDESENKEPCAITNSVEMVKPVSICGQSQKNNVKTRTTRKKIVTVKNEEGTINEPTKSVGIEKYVPLKFDKPGLKSFLLSAYKGQMTPQKIYKHQAFKFSQDDLEKAMEAIEKNPRAQFCSQITKFELATYLLMKQHDFDEDSVACFDNDESFLRIDDTKQFSTAQSKSSENSFEEQNEFEFNMEEEGQFGDEIENYESYLNPCSYGGYKDDFYQRQPQRLLSTSSSEKFLKIPEKFVKSRSFSTSSKAGAAQKWNAFFVKTPTFLRRLRIFRQLYNYKALIDPAFNEADFLEGCKLVSNELFF